MLWDNLIKLKGLRFENIKDKLYMTFLNPEISWFFIDKVVHKPFLNLEIVFYISFDSNNLIWLYNFFDLSNTSIDEIYACAMDNCLRNKPAKMQTSIDCMKGLLDINKVPDEKVFHELMIQPVVLSNETMLEGAICMLYPNILSTYADKIRRDLLIIPSSRHEVLLFPYIDSEACGEMGQFVKFVNSTEVEKEDILSNDVYIYSRSDYQIHLWSPEEENE